MGLAPGAPNLAREWLLEAPPADPAGAPDGCPRGIGAPGARHNQQAGYGRDPRAAGTAQQDNNDDRRCAPDSPLLAPPPGPGPARGSPAAARAQRRGEMLSLCAALQRSDLVLRRLSARRLRSILRPWLGSPWAPVPWRWGAPDVLYAFRHLPDGTPHEYAGAVRDPAALLAHRMSHWLHPGGTPMPPRSAALAARAERDRAAQREVRTVTAATQAAWADSGRKARSGAALARSLCADASPGFTAGLRRNALERERQERRQAARAGGAPRVVYASPPPGHAGLDRDQADAAVRAALLAAARGTSRT
jgi:hypothetical protein